VRFLGDQIFLVYTHHGKDMVLIVYVDYTHDQEEQPLAIHVKVTKVRPKIFIFWTSKLNPPDVKRNFNLTGVVKSCDFAKDV